MNLRARFVPLACAILALAFLPGARAQEPPAAAAPAPTAEEAKRQAKEDRIAEYLRKKEEQRLRRAAEREEALELERQQLAEAEAAAAAQAETAEATGTAAAAPTVVPESKPHSALPRDLARAQASVRRASFAADPTVQGILSMIDAQLASPYQLAAFGNFISEHGLHREAIAYYEVALKLVDEDPVLWVNLGTLRRKVGETSAAQSAYTRALSIDPNYALAHYNLGAIHDSQNHYDQAIMEYKIALALDPNLADPAHNPQAATNQHLAAVKLLLYGETMGGAGLPLSEVEQEEAGTP